MIGRQLLRSPTLMLLLGLFIGPLLGFSVYRLAAAVERDRTQVQLERQAAAAAVAVDSELAADLEVLYGMRTLFELEGPVSRPVFTEIAEPVLARHPSLRALEWAPRVGRSERTGHELALRGEGFTDYSITERDDGRLVPAAADRDVYFPVAYVEPLDGNLPALGFDLTSDSLRTIAIVRAAETGQPALSDPVPLVQGARRSLGVLALLAVHESLSSRQAGRGSPIGFVVAVFDVDRLLQQSGFAAGGGPVRGLLFELLDDDVAGHSVTMFATSPAPELQSAAPLFAEQPIAVGGQAWRLVVRPTEPYLRSLETDQPVLLGAAATTVWWLIVGIVAAAGRRARSRLERRHARLVSNILESLNDGVIVATPGGTILTANRAATAVAGRGAADVPLSAWSETYGLFKPGSEDMFPPDELPLARAIRGEATECVEVFVRNRQVPDGTYVSVSGSPMLDSRGKVRGGVVVFRDISERKRAEERLQRLSSAVEQTADSVVITDRAGIIEYVNPAFEETTGYSSAEAIGRTPRLLKSGRQSDDYYRELWATILRGEPFRGTTINRKKSGMLYWAEQTITALKDTEGRITHFVSVLKDMTERRKVQEQEIELQLAATVQQHLFPDGPPQVAGYDLAGAAFPAAATCGDYYDFVPMSDGALALVVADVSGHGLGPALVMAQTRAYLRSLCLTTSDLALIAGGINRFLEHDLQENFFVTMLLVRLEPASGHLSWVSCAHPSGYIIDRSGRITTELASKCLPLGLFLDRWKCSTDEATLQSGELTVLVTDGVLESESPDGTEFGADRCLEVVSQHREGSAAEIVEAVFRAVRDFTGGREQADDVTIVVCKRHS